MQKLFIYCMLLLSITVNSQFKRCASDEILNDLLSTNLDAQMKLDAIENSVFNVFLKTTSFPTINIPVVVYVVHDNQPLGTGANITDVQVQAQLAALNTYFNPYGINFCLGTKIGANAIPSGQGIQNTPGIIHYNSTSDAVHNANTAGIMSLNNLISVNSTSRSQFLRIWVVKSINGIGSPSDVVYGYSMFPNVSPIFDGVVIRSDVFGNGSPNLIPNYNQGKVLVHEIGHFLGLYHTFQGGCSGMTGNCYLNGDRVCDTPPVATPNFNCIAGTNSCNEPTPDLPDRINNFMDYGDANCATSFTTGQKSRIYDIINLTRSELISDENLLYTGASCASPNILTAKFTPSSYYSCITNNNISFVPLQTSLNYTWDFGDPTTGINNVSSLPNPSHSFSSVMNSPYTVTLTVSNGTNSAVFSSKIYLTNCSAITNPESNWYTSGSNSFSFVSGVPVVNNITLPITGPIPYNSAGTFFESCAFQSNSSGNILFYTNGNYILNGSTNATVNSTQLKGSGTSKNGTVIVPNPANSNQYYVFTKDSFYGLQSNGLNGFNYSVVNVSGTIVTMVSTNVPINFPIGYNTGNNGALVGGEGIVAAQKCNGYWIVTTLKKGTANYIVVYSLTASGLSFTSETLLPVTNSADCFSSFKFSPDGNRLLYTNNSIVNSRTNYLYDFDKYTGTLNNRITLNTPSYGASFSPNSKILYADSGILDSSVLQTNYLYQFDLMSSNIPNSRKIIATFLGDSGDIQIGPDSKLYRNIIGKKKFAIIHNPNQIVDEANPNACNYTFDGIIANNIGNVGMPNLINAKISTAYNNTISYYPTSCTTYKFMPNACGTSFNWEFKNGTTLLSTSTATFPTYTFPGNGIYTIILKNSTNTTTIATTTLTIGFTPPTISGSTTICTSLYGNRTTNNSVLLTAGQTAVWSITTGTGSIIGTNNQSNVTINWTSAGGIISVIITDASGCTRTVNQIITETNTNCAFVLPGSLCATTQTLPDLRDYLFNVPTNGVFSGNGVSFNGTTYSLNDMLDMNPGTSTISYTFINAGTSTTIYSTINIETPITPSISGSNTAYPTTPNNATVNTTTIPSGYTALWTITGGTGTITTANNTASVGIIWTSLPGYVTLTLTSPAGCTYTTTKTILNMRACDCFSTQFFTYTRSGKTVTITRDNSDPTCVGMDSGGSLRTTYNYGDGTTFDNYNNLHTYASFGTYTININSKITGQYDEILCQSNSSLNVTLCKTCIDKLKLDNHIIIYPNPVSSILNFDVSFIKNTIFKAIVRTIDGKILVQKKWDLNGGLHDLQLELPININEGVIFVELISDEIREIRTVLIKK